MITIVPQNSAPSVPYAHGGEITDMVLAAAIQAAETVTAGTASQADMALFVMVAGPAMEELQQRRAQMGLIADLAGGNVLMFPGARG